MMNRVAFSLLVGLAISSPIHAEPLSLERATELALQADPRIEERRQLVEAARSLLQEAQGNKGLIIDVNTFVALAPTYDDGFFTNGSDKCTAGDDCKLRNDSLEFSGVTPWANLEFAIIKPLGTFGKIENYSVAAQGNIDVQRGEVRLQRAKTRADVALAYFGYLTARDVVRLLTDVEKRLAGAEQLVVGWLDEGTGNVKQSDLFALQAGIAKVRRFLIQAQSLERIALDGLKVLTGIGLTNELEVADRFLRPIDLPDTGLDELIARALEKRPEMSQLEAGLRARRALVEAKRADGKPNVYAAIAGSIADSPGRYEVDNPYVYDPFNHAGVTPVIGLRWEFNGDVTSARVAGAQAELDALIAKASFARQGIPFQVAEAYHSAHAQRDMVEQLEQGSRASRRWMIASFADFEAGFEEAGKAVEAFAAYVEAHTDYLQGVNEYNLQVVKLSEVTGDYE